MIVQECVAGWIRATALHVVARFQVGGLERQLGLLCNRFWEIDYRTWFFKDFGPVPGVNAGSRDICLLISRDGAHHALSEEYTWWEMCSTVVLWARVNSFYSDTYLQPYRDLRVDQGGVCVCQERLPRFSLNTENTITGRYTEVKSARKPNRFVSKR